MHLQADEIQGILQETLASQGYELVGVETVLGQRRPILRCYVDVADGQIDVQQLGKASHLILDQLRLVGIDTDEISFEVSSPGLNRRLFTLAQCQAFIGQVIAVKLRHAALGRQRYKGKLMDIKDEVLEIQTDDVGLISCPWHDVLKANVVPDLRAYLTSEKKR